MSDEPGHARATNRLIVKLEPGRYSAEADLRREADALAAAIPGAQVERVSHTGRVLLNLATDTDPVAVAAELCERDGVAYAEPDVIDHAVTPET